MSKPTIEEMAGTLDVLYAASCNYMKIQERDYKGYEAIRAALVKLGGWQKILEDAEKHGQDVRECTFILSEVRDFGQEGKK